MLWVGDALPAEGGNNNIGMSRKFRRETSRWGLPLKTGVALGIEVDDELRSWVQRGGAKRIGYLEDRT